MKTKSIFLAYCLLTIAAHAEEPEVVRLHAIKEQYQAYSGKVIAIEGWLNFGFETSTIADESSKGGDFLVWFDWDPVAIKRTSGENGNLLLSMLGSKRVRHGYGNTLGHGRFRGFIEVSEEVMTQGSKAGLFHGYGHMGIGAARFIITEVTEFEPNKAVLEEMQKEPNQPPQTTPVSAPR